MSLSFDFLFSGWCSDCHGVEIWLRGYVVSSARSAASLASESNSSAEEPQVFVGIFPASHCQIREQLDDPDRRLLTLAAAATNGINSPSVAPPSHLKAGQMASLPEEDEAESPDSPNHVRNHSQPSAAAYTFASPDGRRLSNIPIQPSRAEVNRPPPPLPSLKCGDETAAGITEPLIDEIACALREWATLLYSHLSRRDYALFQTVKAHIDALHAGRKTLLASTLSAAEASALRADLVNRLVRGNIIQGLDILVRHPIHGSLVEVDEDSEHANQQAWVDGIRMYAMQVALAYTAMNEATTTTALGQPDHALSALTLKPGGLTTASDLASGRPLSVSMSSTALAADGVASTASRFHHVALDLRQFNANPCAAGENCELSFSLFNKTDARFVTDEFCVILDHRNEVLQAQPRRTLFVDLSANDLQDSIFLVCRIVKNGVMKNSTNQPTSSLLHSPSHDGMDPDASFVASTMLGTENDNSFLSMVSNARNSTKQTVRRPFGCAVLDISQLPEESTGDANGPPTDRTMPIFVPASEAAFSTLHEDIIASRIKDFEKSPRADAITVRVRVFRGAAGVDILANHQSLLSGAVATQRLGFPDVVEPGAVRNDVFVKLWSGEFALGSLAGDSGGGFGKLTSVAGGPKSVEVSAEVRRRDGSTVHRVISRGTGEPMVTQYNSMVFKSNNAPTYGELFRLEIPPQLIESCHLFFTFRHRSAKERSSTSTGSIERPFAFGYLPLFPDNGAFIQDGSHSLQLYRYERSAAVPSVYFECPSLSGSYQSSQQLPPSLIKTIVPLRDMLIIRTFLCMQRRYLQ